MREGTKVRIIYLIILSCFRAFSSLSLNFCTFAVLKNKHDKNRHYRLWKNGENGRRGC